MTQPTLTDDPDVKALLRMAVVWNVPFACNRSSADFIISSPLMATEYQYPTPDYTGYLTRDIEDLTPDDELGPQ